MTMIVTMHTDMNAAGWAARLMDAGCKVLTSPAPFGRTRIFVQKGRAHVSLTMDPSRAARNVLEGVTPQQRALIELASKAGAVMSAEDRPESDREYDQRRREEWQGNA